MTKDDLFSTACRNRFLLRGASSSAEHARLLRQCRSTTERQLDLCRDHRTRSVARACQPPSLVLIHASRCARSGPRNPRTHPVFASEPGYRGAAGSQCCPREPCRQLYVVHHLNHIQRLTRSSGEQGPDCSPRWSHPADPTDDVPQRRGAVQCRRLHYELGNTRRQQVQDCPVGCSGPVDTARKVQGYACPT